MKIQLLLGLFWTVSCAPGSLLLSRDSSQKLDYNAKAEHVISLRQVEGKTGEGAQPLPSRHSLIPGDHQPGAADLKNHEWIFYIADVIVGKQTIPLQVDTGSADTWFVQDSFSCVAESQFGGAPTSVPAKACGFGPGFKGTPGLGVIKDQLFYRKYGDRTFAKGYYGFDDVSIGGITAKHQQVAVVNYTEWFGDQMTSGILGLAYPLMTGLDNEGHIDTHVPEYDPIFTTMWKQNLTLPLFSLALSRSVNRTKDSHDSYLSFGGVPPVDYDDSGWARTPIQLLQDIPGWNSVDTKERGLYIITPDAVVYGKKSDGQPKPDTEQNTYLIDAGSTLTVLPTDMFQKIKQMFDPVPDWHGWGRSYYTACNASIPTVGIQIGSQVFYMDPEDLLRQGSRDDTGELCRVGLDEGYNPPYMLGVPFLNNVVAVFDVGNNEMRFAPRKRV